MQRWFLSYHSPDWALAERLKAAIEKRDRRSRVFFAPMNLRAGRSWTAQLAREIAEADAFILLVGVHGLGDWQVLEYDEALDKRSKSPDYPIIPVLLEGQAAPGLPFLRHLHWIITPDPACEKDIGRLFDGASGDGAKNGELWRYTSPYRGLAAMEEKDSDYFFGRERETIETLSTMAVAPDQLPLLIGNSGVGKSSLARAGVLAALKRQAWPVDSGETGEWPRAFADSRRWCFLTMRPGADPIKALVEQFSRIWQFDSTDPRREIRKIEWIENLNASRNTLSGLLTATEAQFAELGLPKPPGFLLYIDQGEELYARSEERARLKFSEILVQSLTDPRLRVMMSLRADFFGALQRDRTLFDVRRHIDVPPLIERDLVRVVSRPALLLSARFETTHLAGDIARRAAEESVKDAGALPLLSYLLDDMWKSMVERGDGELRVPALSIDLGLVLKARADTFLSEHQDSEERLRRIFTLKLATVREDGEPTRRRASRSEFADDEWLLVSELANHPNRLLVTTTLDGGETFAEVAHEAIFRRWDKLREWITAEREFLAWHSSLETARFAWQTMPERSKNDALLMGFALTQALRWLSKRAEALPVADRNFIRLSHKVARRQKLRVRTLIGVFFAAMLTGLAAWSNEKWLSEKSYALINANPLNAAREAILKPKESFQECTKCPIMTVVVAGSFTMGSPPDRGNDDEHPQHNVTIAKPLAVSKFEVTFSEWDACAAHGDCSLHVNDSGWGRGQQPVINVSWEDAQSYAAWLSRITGRKYRLLSEAEYEYAMRAGQQTAYSWGNEISSNGTVMANCNGCGSKWDLKQPAPIGSFAANGFGLYDMAGNVFEWTEDCYHDTYNGAPIDGTAWTGNSCSRRVIRGGSWVDGPEMLLSAVRSNNPDVSRGSVLGFRVGRTLLTN